jgi:hypothetical protein
LNYTENNFSKALYHALCLTTWAYINLTLIIHFSKIREDVQ